MRVYQMFALALAGVAAGAVLSCENVDTGQLEEDRGPPVLRRILIQDELPSGGRHMATDLLDHSPAIACSLRDPCPAGDKFSHPLCDFDASVCPDPLNPAQTPPAIGTPGSLGGNQIRLVMTKQLDPDIEEITLNMMTGATTGYSLKDPTIVGLFDAGGRELKSLKYWDPVGATLTSDIFADPFGPALVIKPMAPLVPLTKYSIRLRPDQIKDGSGQALATDINGAPVAASYDFTTEAFSAAGGNQSDLTDTMKNPDGAIDVADVLAIRTNARFDYTTLKVTVTRAGQPVEILANPAYGTDPKGCDAAKVSPTQINIFRTTAGVRTDWDEGEYAVSIDVVAVDPPRPTLSLNGLGKAPFKDVVFKTRKNIDKDKLFRADMTLLESECASSGPPKDMAMPPVDAGMGG